MAIPYPLRANPIARRIAPIKKMKETNPGGPLHDEPNEAGMHVAKWGEMAPPAIPMMMRMMPTPTMGNPAAKNDAFTAHMEELQL